MGKGSFLAFCLPVGLVFQACQKPLFEENPQGV
jgi:hypothetical protein